MGVGCHTRLLFSTYQRVVVEARGWKKTSNMIIIATALSLARAEAAPVFNYYVTSARSEPAEIDRLSDQVFDMTRFERKAYKRWCEGDTWMTVYYDGLSLIHI